MEKTKTFQKNKNVFSWGFVKLKYILLSNKSLIFELKIRINIYNTGGYRVLYSDVNPL